MSTQRGGAPTKRVVSRDTLSFLGGWGLMIYEAVRADPFNQTVFLAGMVIAIIPGAAQAFALWVSGRMPLPSPGSPEQASSEASST